MKTRTHSGGMTIETDRYRFTLDMPQLLGRLDVKGSGLYYDLSLLTAVDTVGRADRTLALRLRPAKRSAGCCEVAVSSRSSLWAGKTLRFLCRDDELECELSVRGRGRIDRVYWFRGNYRGDELGSVPGFDYVFNPCPNFIEKPYFHATEYTSINAGHETFAWGFALNAGPLCFAFSRDLKPPWLTIGLAAREGEHDFQAFEFNHKPQAVAQTHDSIVGTQSLSLSYYGHRRVSGEWSPPRLVFQFAREKYAAVGQYVRWLRDRGLVPQPPARQPRWWRGSIFCGWHEQVAEGLRKRKAGNLGKAELEAGPAAFAECTQRNYTRWLDRLADRGIRPGIVIIDALWQAACDTPVVDPQKWPDLRGFADACHERGQRLLLWVDVWKRGLVPDGECLRVDGKPVCHDPTHPAYERRLKEQVRTMLSDGPGGYNADGFKVDGTSLEPYGYGMKTHGGRYGFELQKHLIRLIHDEAVRVKPDALISLFIADPYFADVCGMVRLGDMYTVKGDPLDTMRWRRRIAQIAMPGVSIDTDGLLRFCVRPGYLRLVAEQARLGPPTLYNARRMDRRRTFTLPVCHDLTEGEYREIARAFGRR